MADSTFVGLASAFHGYYNRVRVVTEDAPLTPARLALAGAVGLVLRNGLGLMGVAAAGGRGAAGLGDEEADLGRLALPEEISLIKRGASYPDVLAACARGLEPQPLAQYLVGLAAAFHGYYNRVRVITEDTETSRARLALVQGVGVVLRNGLDLMGVTQPRTRCEPGGGGGAGRRREAGRSRLLERSRHFLRSRLLQRSRVMLRSRLSVLA